jgi:hypothetical protein
VNGHTAAYSCRYGGRTSWQNRLGCLRTRSAPAGYDEQQGDIGIQAIRHVPAHAGFRRAALVSESIVRLESGCALGQKC